MDNNTSRFTKLLGECRRQMNGAVASSMRYYGDDYGLNYGVSLPTIRTLAEGEGKDHKFAKYLYQQQVREIRLASLHIAQAEQIADQELAFWAEGIINSEVAEEAAFALFQYADSVIAWIDSEDELLIYTALLSISKSKIIEVTALDILINRLMRRESMLINSAIITLVDNYYRHAENQKVIDDIISVISVIPQARYIVEEISWRCECYK